MKAVPAAIPSMVNLDRTLQSAAGWGLSAVWHVQEIQRLAHDGDLTRADLQHHADQAARHARYAWHIAGRRLAKNEGQP